MIEVWQRRLHGLPAVPIALGVWAAAVALTRTPALAALLIAPVALAAVAFWTVAGATRWIGLFFLCALLTPPLPVPMGDAGLHIAPLAAALGMFTGLLRWPEWRQLHGRIPTLLGAFLVVLAGSSILAAFYSGPAIAAGSFVRVILFALGAYVFVYTLAGPGSRSVDPLRFTRFLFYVAVLAAGFACVDFYFQFPAPAGYGPQFVWLTDGVFRRAQGLFYEASTLGNFCVFFLVMIVVAWSRHDDAAPLPRVVLGGGAIVFSLALISSYSRASIVSFCVAVLALAYVKRIRIRRIVISIAGVAAVAGVVAHWAAPALFNTYWSRLVGSIEYLGASPDSVLSGRLTNWEILASFLVRQPWHAFLGIGYKTLPYSDFAGAPIIADNTYLSLLAETGIVGLGVFLLLNAAMLRGALTAARSLRGRTAFFGTWMFCFWSGQLVQMLSGDLITYWRVLPLYFWLLATAIRESEEDA